MHHGQKLSTGTDLLVHGTFGSGAWHLWFLSGT